MAQWHEGLANLSELEYEQTGRDQLHREPASDRPTPGIRESNIPPQSAALFVPWQPRSTRQYQHPDGLQSQPQRAVHRFKQDGKIDSLAVWGETVLTFISRKSRCRSDLQCAQKLHSFDSGGE